jgi:hypothetical protein
MKDDRPKGHDKADSMAHPESGDHHSTNDHHGRFATREEFRAKFGREMANMVATERAIMGRDRHIMRQMRFRGLQPDFQGGYSAFRVTSRRNSFGRSGPRSGPSLSATYRL